MVDKCASNSLRRRLLRETHLTFDRFLQIARSIEASDLLATNMEEASDMSRQVNKICSGSQRSNEKIRGSSRSRRPTRGIHEHPAMTRGQLSVFVVDVRVIAQKILLVLQSEKLAVTVENKGILQEFAKALRKSH